MSTREPGVNQVIADILRGMRRRWKVQSEPGGAIRGGSKTPDILITERGALPLMIENEFADKPANSVEADATGRLGLNLEDGGQEMRAVIALRTPEQAATAPQHELEAWLRDCRDFDYALYRRQRADDDIRWPANGWLRGSLAELALLAQQAVRPDEEIDELAEQLQTHISDAEVSFTQAYPQGAAEVAAMLADTLRLEDDRGRQARRMAMAMLANALIFQQSLAQGMTGIPTPSSMYMDDNLVQQETVGVWHDILKKNYFPIFFVAREILKWIDQPAVAEEILAKLYAFLTKLFRSDGATRSHDLTGFVFQRLIADRKFLATFYTRPESAALLAALALPRNRPPGAADWSDAQTLKGLRIADFACGTGTLLSAVYNRLGALHELHGGDAQTLHSNMIERVLVGCDVLPMATHLTLSMLASAQPEQRFEHSQILTMRYGRQERTLGKTEEYDYALGSLDLLNSQIALPTLATRPTAVEGAGESEAQERHEIDDNSFDLVIMNPPFTRPTGHEGKRIGVSVPSFAALGTSDEDQRAMSRLLSLTRHGNPYHGNAGLASAFLGLADKKLKIGGTLALVMPQSMLSGQAWEKARTLLRRHYSDIVVVTIAGEKVHEISFSADTGLGECLVIAHKWGTAEGRVRFLSLRERPRSELDGLTIGHSVQAASSISRMEDGPVGGTPIQVGRDEVGQVLEFSLPENGSWQLAGILDLALAQTSFQVANGLLWLPRMSRSEARRIPITLLGDLTVEDALYHMDISSKWVDKRIAPRAPFDLKRPPINRVPAYPVIWAHDASQERRLEINHDSEAILRRSDDTNVHEEIIKNGRKVWAKATRAHINRDFRLNSQSLCVAMTPEPSIGGHGWPSVNFPKNLGETWEPAFSVWCNSTLGILMYWWQASRQQSGRSRTSVKSLPALPTLDLRALSDEQLAAAVRIFEDMKHCPMLPVNQIDEDPVRAELDRRLLTEVLGLPADLCAPDGPMELLRRKLAAEPSIHGGKISKVTLDVPEGCLPD